MTDIDEAEAIAQLTERLATQFPQIAGDTVERVVTTAHGHYGDAPIRSYVPLLVEHDAVEALWLLASTAVDADGS